MHWLSAVSLLFILLWPPGTLQAAGSHYEEAITELAESVVIEVRKRNRATLAVVNFTDLEGSVTPIGRFVAEELSASLALSGDVQVLDRKQLEKLLPESAISKLTTSDPDTAKKFGVMAGVDSLVAGTVQDSPEGVRVTAKILATDTGLVIGGSRSLIARTGPIAKLLEPPPPPPPAPPPAKPGAPPGTPTHQNEWYRMFVGSATRSGNTITVMLFIENLAGRDFRLLCRLNETYLLDDAGGKWKLQASSSREGLCVRGLTLQRGTKKRAIMEFIQRHGNPTTTLTLQFHENRPRRDMIFTIPDIKVAASAEK